MIVYKPLNVFAWAKIIRKGLLLEHQICFPEGVVYEDNYWNSLLHIYADYIYIVGKKLYHYFVHALSTVQARNEEHHLDRITVQMMKWEDYKRRGLLQIYREELEYDLLFYAVCFIITLVSRYDHPSYSYYQLQREVVRDRIPDYVMDSYAGAFSDIEGACFETLHRPLDRVGFQDFVERVRGEYTHYINSRNRRL